MDAVAPALIGLGIYLMYEAWKSHQTGNPPTPIAKIKGALSGSSVAPLGAAGTPNQPSVTVIAPAGQVVPGASVQPS